MLSVNDVRNAFLSFFQKENHTILPSASLLPHNDPTLMFTNAGMVPFKNMFTGAQKPSALRVTTAQKCVRAGGKHNDLDNVGYTARHHTFFEMLGNFSFGDYFKERAIELAWKLITKEFGFAKDRLLVTIYHDDEEAFNLWKKMAMLQEDRIIRIASTDNFWSMGETGPCGPCSEIFYDQGPHLAGGPPGSAEEAGDRYLEFWNLVFMQYEQGGGGERIPLPKPSIDTGMGLERVCALLQGVSSNYETDLFRTLIHTIADLTHQDAHGAHRASHRVIADHLRACAFLIAEGVLPSNEGRGYVLRRIMRRAMRHAQMLGAKDPLMFRLVPTLLSLMGQAYPELIRAQGLIEDTLRLEEERFRTTLTKGLVILEEETQNLSKGQTLAGDIAFKLYDTYGFPLDLTQDALRSRDIHVDMVGFEQAMARQKAEARKAWTGSGEARVETIWFELKETRGSSEFLGYNQEEAEGIVIALVQDQEEVERIQVGQKGYMLTNQTPFYGESGGQVGDAGWIIGPHGRGRITQTHKRLGDLLVHDIEVEAGVIHRGDRLILKVDSARRNAIKAHHSATHILHEALRQVLGDHIAQKGSLVAPDRLRFDFVHPKPLTLEERMQIEDLANHIILQNTSVETRVMDVESAMNSGARALFGEKYGAQVRVVSIGERVEASHLPFSVELCGGTHVRRTGEIGLLHLISENGVAAGIRRVEAKTGHAARLALCKSEQQLEEIAARLKTTPQESLERLIGMLEENRKLERALQDAKRQLAFTSGSSQQEREDEKVSIKGIACLTKILQEVEIKDLKSLVDEAKTRLKSGMIAFIGLSPDGKASLVVGITADLTDRYNAVDFVRLAAPFLGGKGGGGRPDMAQAGGPEGAGAPSAIKAILDHLRKCEER